MSTETTTTPKPPMIYGRIADALADVGTVGKNRRNQQQGYDFRSIDDFYDCLQPVLAKHRIFIAPTILEHSREERTTKSGGCLMTTLTKVRFKLFAEDGSFIEADALGEGADSGDKSANKAAAGAMKYLFMQVFSVRVSGENHDSENDSPQYGPRNSKTPPKGPPTQQSAPKVNPERSQATAVDVLPRKATAKTRERMLAVLGEQFTEHELNSFAFLTGYIKHDQTIDDWPLEKVPTSKEELNDLGELIASRLPAPPDADDLPLEIANVVIHIPPAHMKRDEYLKNPDTIGSLYKRRKEDQTARERLWGFANSFAATGFQGNPPTAQDIALRKGLDAFSKFYEEKKGLAQ